MLPCLKPRLQIAEAIEAHNTKPQNKNEIPIPFFFVLISHITLIPSAENR